MQKIVILCLVAIANATVKPRRTDITDLGYRNMFWGWVDVQGQGVKNDYCRFVGPETKNGNKWLSCALAGTQGKSQYNYNPPNGGLEWLDPGYNGSAYMADENKDGKDDFCRCIGIRPDTKISCMLADRFGFDCDQYGYTVPGATGCDRS